MQNGVSTAGTLGGCQTTAHRRISIVAGPRHELLEPCQPIGLALIGKNYIQLVETEVQRPSAGHIYSENTAIEVVLLNALLANFPCEK